MQLKNEFKVSVIVPVFNAEKFVRRAAESAVQLAEVGEVILIDDGGPDNSLDICQQLQQQFDKVRLLRHPDGLNHGPGASRNLGICNANFDCIAFLDADDYYLPNRFEKDREILQADETVDGVYGAIGIHYESLCARKLFHDAGFAYQEFLTLSAPVPPEELIEVLFRCHPRVTGQFSTIALTIRKSLLERSGLFNEHLRLRQDTHLWRRLAAVGRLVPGSIDKSVAIRGVHGANRMTNKAEQAQFSAEYWWDSLHEWFRRTPRVPNRAKRSFRLSYRSYWGEASPGGKVEAQRSCAG
jgi:glycosyltransferase involved in cell wall biosynthesis